MAWQQEVVQRTNYAVNPSYRATSGTTSVRTNLCTNPSMGANINAHGYWPGSGSPASSSAWRNASDTPRGNTGYMRVTWTAAPATGGGYAGTIASVDGGYTYTFSIYVRPSVTLTMTAQGQWYNSNVPTTAIVGSPATTCPANQWTRVSVTSTSATTDNQYQFRVYTNGAGVTSNTTIDFDDCLVEQTDTLQPYFDGSSKLNLCPSPSVALSNNGSSYPYAPDPSVSHTGNLGSTRFDGIGTTSTIISAYGLGGLGGSAGVPVTSGVSYTLSCWVLPNSPVSTNAYCQMNFRNAGGTITSVQGAITLIPQGAGWTQVFVTTTSPSDAVSMYATAAVVRSTGNTVSGQDSAWITDTLLEAGATSPGPFYQGLTPAWTGTANASTSFLVGNVPAVTSSAKIYTYSYGQSQWVTGNNTFCVNNSVAGGARLTLLSVSSPTVGSPGEYWSGKFEARVVPGSTPSLGLSVQLVAYSVAGSSLGPQTDTAYNTLPTDGSWQTISVVSNAPLPADSGTIRWYVVENPTVSGGQILEVRNFVLEKVSGPGIPAGSYFDGATPATTKPYTSYRWTGVADLSTSQKYLPQQVMPTADDSRSAQSGYQGTYTVDAVDIQNFAFGISKVAHAVPEMRGSHTTVPGRSGVIPRFNRSYDAPELALSMWVIGCEPDGSVPGQYSARYATFRRNLTTLMQLFGAQNAVSNVVWSPVDSAMPSLVARVISNGIPSLETMMARQRAEITVSMTLIEAFWKSRNNFVEASAPSASMPHTLPLLNAGSAPVEDAVLTITGPVSLPRVTCQTSGAWVQYNSTVAAGKTLIIDSGAGTATIDGVSVMAQITHGGHPLLMYIPSRVAGLDSLTAMALAPVMTLSGTGGGASTKLSVSYNSKFLVGI